MAAAESTSLSEKGEAAGREQGPHGAMQNPEASAAHLLLITDRGVRHGGSGIHESVRKGRSGGPGAGTAWSHAEPGSECGTPPIDYRPGGPAWRQRNPHGWSEATEQRAGRIGFIEQEAKYKPERYIHL